MRRVQNETDEQALKLLNEGAANAAGKETTDKKLAQLSDQVRMLQYSLSKIFQTLGSYPAVKAQIDQLDYRTLGIARAVAEVTSRQDFDDLVEKHAEQAKVDAFNELSDEDDKNKDLVDDADGEVTDKSWIILSSVCEAFPDQGMFRSKMEVGGAEFAEYKDSFIGKKVGETVDAKIMGKDHLVTILGLRKKKPAGETSDASSQS